MGLSNNNVKESLQYDTPYQLCSLKFIYVSQAHYVSLIWLTSTQSLSLCSFYGLQ